MQCKNVEKTAVTTFYTVQQMHTQSFTIPQFLKIGLTHKKVPVESPTVATCPFAGERGEALGCAFQRRKMRGVATNVYLWKKSEKPTETGQNEISKFGSCIYV